MESWYGIGLSRNVTKKDITYRLSTILRMVRKFKAIVWNKRLLFKCKKWGKLVKIIRQTAMMAFLWAAESCEQEQTGSVCSKSWIRSLWKRNSAWIITGYWEYRKKHIWDGNKDGGIMQKWCINDAKMMQRWCRAAVKYRMAVDETGVWGESNGRFKWNQTEKDNGDRKEDLVGLTQAKEDGKDRSICKRMPVLFNCFCYGQNDWWNW